MLSTTPLYREKANLPGGKEYKISIQFAIENIDFKEVATIRSNGELFYSQSAELKDETKSVELQFKTLEYNFYSLDGLGDNPKQTTEYMGYISNVLSDENGVYQSTRPIISISADSLHYNLIGTTIDFDLLNKDYAVDFDVRYYDNDTLLKMVEKRNNTSYQAVEVDGCDNVNKIEIEIISSNLKYRRARIQNIIFGLNSVIDNDRIISFSRTMEISPFSKEISQNELSVEIENYDGLYDPQNPTGIYSYFDQGQKINHYYYFDVGNDNWEKIYGGQLYLAGKPTDNGETTTFTATGLYQQLTKVYNKGLYYPAGRTFYDLFNDIFEFCDLKNKGIIYEIPENLKNISTVQPITNIPCNEAIQLLCNASNHILIERTNGNVALIPNNVGENTIFNSSALLSADKSETYFSQVSKLNKNLPFANYQFKTLEYNLYSLDGTGANPVETTDYFGGIIDVLSDSNGAYETPIKIIAESKEDLTYFIPLIHIVFDTYNNEAIKDFDIAIYNSDELVDTISVTDNTSIELLYEDGWYGNKIEFIIKKSQMPYRRPRIERLEFYTDFYEISLNIQTSYPEYSEEVPLLSDVKVSLYNLNVAAESSSLYEGELNIQGRQTVRLEYQLSTEQSAEVTNGTIISQNFYAYGCELEIEAAGPVQIKVMGLIIESVASTVNYYVNETGETAELDNIFLTNEVIVDNYALFMIHYLQENKRYNVSWRGEPSLQANDNVSLETKYESGISALVIASNYSQNQGASTGALTLKNLLPNSNTKEGFKL